MIVLSKALVGSYCTQDYLLIPSIDNYALDEYCGGTLGEYGPTPAIPTTILSKCS